MTPHERRTWLTGSQVFVRGRRWRLAGTIAGEDCDALRLIALGASAAAPSLTILVPFDRPTVRQNATAIKVLRPRRWLHELDRVLANLHPFGALSETARARIRLIAYQLEPALAVLRDGATRLLIADAVGLGKTIQAGVLLAELHASNDGFRAIVIVPAGLREQWAAELRSRLNLAAAVVDAAWLRHALADRPPDVNPWSLPGIYVASHDFVKRAEALKPLEDVTWDLAIVDEAHHASLGTDRRAAIDAIASRSLRVVLLTATPPRDPLEFQALCRIGREGESGESPALFARQRADVESSVPRRSTVLCVTPSPAEARMHALLDRYTKEVWKEARARDDEGARLASIVLRKRALSSAGSLAASVDRRLTLLVSPDAEQIALPLDDRDEDPLDDDVPASALAVPGLADGRRERRWLSAIAEAARSAARAETKVAYLLRLLRRVREPVIVFTEYRDTLLRLQRHVSATGRPVVVLHGGMDAIERSRVPRAFDSGALTLLATDAAAEGLNLQRHCRVVVHFELPWNPARLEQRAGRVDRIGQTRRVHEIALVASSTAERLVIAPLTIKASQSGEPVGRTPMLGALTESRVAAAVMAGISELRKSVATPRPPRSTVSVEAIREAERLEHVRALSRRSPAIREAAAIRDAPFITRLTRNRANDGYLARARASLVLLYSIALESSDGRRAHEEILALAVPPMAKCSPSRRMELRALFEPDSRASGAIGQVVEDKCREIAGRVKAADHRRRQRLEERSRAIDTIKRSAARVLVQLALFSRRRRQDAERDPAPAPVETQNPPPLEIRARLIAGVVIDGRRR